MPVFAEYSLEVDWDNDGLFEGGVEDITSFLFDVSWSRGKNYASMLTGRAVTANLIAELRNSDGRFNSFNTASPITNTNIVPGRRCRFHIGALDAALFTAANSEYLSLADNAALSVGDVPLDIYTWVYATSTPTAGNTMGILGKWAAGDLEYLLFLDNTGGTIRFKFQVRNTADSTTTTVTASTFGTPSTATWYAIHCYHDPTGNVIGIAVNDGTADTAATTGGVRNGTAAFEIGRHTAANYFDGRVATTGFWKRTASNLSATELTQLYNLRKGLLYERIQNSLGTSLTTGLVAYWNMVEASGTRADAASTNNLTDNNTVTQAAGPGQTLFDGYLEKIEPQPRLSGAHLAQLRAFGPLGRIAQKNVHTTGNANQLSGAAIGVILDEASWSTPLRNIDVGQTTLIRWWEDEHNAFDAGRDIEETEQGYLGESSDGKIIFEDRHHRLLAPHTTSQATWSDDAAAALRYNSINQLDAWKEIFNRIEVPVRFFTVGATQELWRLAASGADSPTLDAGEVRTFFANFPTFDSTSTQVAVDTWTTPVATTDFTVNTQADGLGSDLTASITISVVKKATIMEITLTNTSASNGFLTLLKARGTPINAGDETFMVAEDATSQTAYGIRSYAFPAPLQGSVQNALDYARAVLAVYKGPVPVLKVGFQANRDATRFAEMIVRDVSDRVTIVANNNADLGINEDFFVENMRHHINVARHHEVEFECSSAALGGGGFWILGVSTLGVSTKLGY